MAKEIKRIWIVGEGNGDTVSCNRVYGTEDQVKGYIAKRVRELKASDEDGSFDYGTTSKKDIKKDQYIKNQLCGCAVFSDFHVDITAIPEEDVKVVKL